MVALGLPDIGRTVLGLRHQEGIGVAGAAAVASAGRLGDDREPRTTGTGKIGANFIGGGDVRGFGRRWGRWGGAGEGGVGGGCWGGLVRERANSLGGGCRGGVGGHRLVAGPASAGTPDRALGCDWVSARW